VAQTNEGRFEVDPDDHGVHAAYRVTDGYYPQSVAIPVARAGGVTSVIAVPRGGLVAGTSACFALADSPSVDRVTVRAPTAMHVTLGEAARAAGSGSRGRALERLREVLDDAAQYGKRKGEFERNQTREFSASRLDLEALAPVAQGRLAIVARAHRSSDILAAVRLAADLKAPLVVAGATEAWQVADELAAAKATVILNPIENLPSTFDEIHVRDDAVAVLDRAGVTVLLSTLDLYDFDGAQNVRNLRQVAGAAVAQGLSWDRALAAVTTAPARAFGLGKRGTIAKGAPADVVIWSGDPFELTTRVEAVFVNGVEQSLRTRQTLLLERYRTLTPR
jgi:imidazolonepropionase-like amidohydrolase